MTIPPAIFFILLSLKRFVFIDYTKIDVPLASGPMITNAKLAKFTVMGQTASPLITRRAFEPSVCCATHIKPYFTTPSASIHICEIASPPQYPMVPGTLDRAQNLTPTPNTLVITGPSAVRFNSV